MDEHTLKAQYLFSDQNHRDKMVIETILKVNALAQENRELRREVAELKELPKGVPKLLVELENKSYKHHVN